MQGPADGAKVFEQDSQHISTNAATQCALVADNNKVCDDTILQNSLQVEATQVQLQNEDLQKDRLRLLHQLRESATQVSDKGVRFVGLSPGHLEMVRSYASSLCEGRNCTLQIHQERHISQPTNKLEQLVAARKKDAARIDDLEAECNTTSLNSIMNINKAWTLVQKSAVLINNVAPAIWDFSY